MRGLVYHIRDPRNIDIDEGYVGVTKASKGVHRRFIEHSKMSHHMRSKIKKYDIRYEDVITLFEGDLDVCYELEAKLRPHQKMGWNIAAGGSGPNYHSNIEDLSKFRSELQTSRMQQEELKEKQGKTFKENYYANDQSQALRSMRAIQHMADEDKRTRCLNAMHKNKKCPYCDFENNSGNVAIHIGKYHRVD